MIHSSSLSPQYTHDNRASDAPTASSAYSHDLAYYENPTATSPYEGISPPSSPEPDQRTAENSGQPRRFRSMRDVSPVEEKRGKGVVSDRASNIPVLRKAPTSIQPGETQSAQQKFWDGKVAPNSKVKWDEYSGEPAASGAGRFGSVSPGTYAKGIASGNPQLMGMGYHVSVSGPEKKNNVSFSDRVGRLGTRPPAVETTKHEPWSRATGRSQIAPPLKYQPAAKPLQIPRKSLSPTCEELNQDAPNAHAASLSRGAVGADTGFVADRSHDNDAHDDLIKPTVPLKVGRNTPPRGFTSPVTPKHPTGLGIRTPLSYPSPVTPIQRQRQESPDTIIHGQGFAKELPAQQRVSTPPQEPVGRTSTDQTPDSKQASNSRFSWTTYNSNTTYQHSPPPSPPNLPTITPPRQRVVTEPISAATAAFSILSRRRPIPSSEQTPSPLPLRKSLDSDSPGTATITAMSSPTSYAPPSPSATSIYSTATTGTSKALPLPPTSLAACDHISVLESAMEDLRIRRSNVYRLLSDLNNAAPANPLLTDFKRARVAEQRKRGFEDELSEIKREEYEVGMRLHRAWKKREREDPNQAGSAIWVRRVTS
jgi:hypothetical protein